MGKSKRDILNKISEKDLRYQLERWYYTYWYWDDEDEDYPWWGDEEDENSLYEYLPDESQPAPKEYIIKRGRPRFTRYSFGKLIDMSTIYSKEILRQKKLMAILEGDYNLFDTKTYLIDLVDEKSKDILGKLDRG
jgi:hypothetical protein